MRHRRLTVEVLEDRYSVANTIDPVVSAAFLAEYAHAAPPQAAHLDMAAPTPSPASILAARHAAPELAAIGAAVSGYGSTHPLTGGTGAVAPKVDPLLASLFAGQAAHGTSPGGAPAAQPAAHGGTSAAPSSGGNSGAGSGGRAALLAGPSGGAAASDAAGTTPAPAKPRAPASAPGAHAAPLPTAPTAPSPGGAAGAVGGGQTTFPGGLAPTVDNPSDPYAAGDLVRMASGLSAGLPSTFSSNPVRYYDGVVELSATDLSSGAGGTSWGLTRSWTNGTNYANGFNGTGMVVTQLPHLRQDSGGTLTLVSNGYTTRSFDPNGSGGYTERYYGLDTLVPDATNGQYHLIDTLGDQITLSDFSSSYAAARRGQLRPVPGPQRQHHLGHLVHNRRQAGRDPAHLLRDQPGHRVVPVRLRRQRRQRRVDEFGRAAPPGRPERVVGHRAPGGVHLLRRQRGARRRGRPQAGRGRGRLRQRPGHHLLPLLHLEHVARLHRRPGVRLRPRRLRPADRGPGHRPVLPD